MQRISLDEPCNKIVCETYKTASKTLEVQNSLSGSSFIVSPSFHVAQDLKRMDRKLVRMNNTEGDFQR